MTKLSAFDSAEIKQLALLTIDRMRNMGQPVWKPKKGQTHVENRIERGHVSKNFTLPDYNDFIMSIVKRDDHELYLYFKQTFDQRYFVVGNGVWIVIVGENGFMETAFPPDQYDAYLSNEGYYYLGKIKEVRADGQ
ncbi:MAG: hypothetical protein ACXVOI_07535 [Tumebacillaceae bacterium]